MHCTIKSTLVFTKILFPKAINHDILQNLIILAQGNRICSSFTWGQHEWPQETLPVTGPMSMALPAMKLQHGHCCPAQDSNVLKMCLSRNQVLAVITVIPFSLMKGQECHKNVQGHYRMPIMLNKHFETRATVEQELHCETSKMSGCLTSLTAALKSLKVAEFTIWTGITSFNFLFSIKKTVYYQQLGCQFYFFKLLPCQSNVW